MMEMREWESERGRVDNCVFMKIRLSTPRRDESSRFCRIDEAVIALFS